MSNDRELHEVKLALILMDVYGPDYTQMLILILTFYDSQTSYFCSIIALCDIAHVSRIRKVGTTVAFSLHLPFPFPSLLNIF